MAWLLKPLTLDPATCPVALRFFIASLTSHEMSRWYKTHCRTRQCPEQPLLDKAWGSTARHKKLPQAQAISHFLSLPLSCPLSFSFARVWFHRIAQREGPDKEGPTVMAR